MPRHNENRHTIQILFTKEVYENIKRYAALNNKSMNAVIREFTEMGLNGELTQQNVDYLTPIIRKQLESVIDVKIERLAALTAKTCVQSGTAAYLSAEAMKSFVPVQERREFLDAYDAARKKAVAYLKNSGNLNSIIKNSDDEVT